MIVRYWQLVIVMLAVVVCSGCNVSLQSSQYAFVKNLLKSKPQVAEKSWRVSWGGRDYPVYAVNHEGGIYFANESGLLVTFDGSQVTSLSLRGPRGKKALRVVKEVLDDGAISLEFQNEDGIIMDSHLCSMWQPETTSTQSKGWNQECADGLEMYTNEIRANDQNQVVSLKQVLAPGVAPIVIAHRL